MLQIRKWQVNNMKRTKLIAAVIAAATAITPLSINASASITFTDGTGSIAKLPEWIPSDFDSAVEFRNTYGATHFDNGLICIVYPDRAKRGASEDTYGYELKLTEEMGTELKHEIYTHEMTEACFDVFVYQPQKQGDIVLTIVDPHVQAKDTPDDWEPPAIAEYSFTIDQNLSITETDIFSWLPDSMTEYDEYTKKNGDVSVKDNYVVFCTMTVDQLGDKWEPDGNNKYENIKYLLTSDCTMQVPDLYDDGSIDKIYVYQAVKDGNEKISWIRTSKAEPISYTLTANCAILNNAQTILLPGQIRATLVDYDTGETIALTDDKTPYIWTNISNGAVSTGPILTMETNPAIISNDLGGLSDGKMSFGLEERNLPEGYSFIDDEKRPGYYSGTIIPEKCMTVTRYENGSADVVFRLKFTPTGDINNDGEINVADVLLLQKWLLGSTDVKPINWKAADFCNDNVLNVFDLCLMRAALIQTINTPVAVSITESGGVAGANIVYKIYRKDRNYFLYYIDLTSDIYAEPTIIPISEEDYRDIMSQSYTSYTEASSAPIRWSEIDYSITLSYPDGSQKNASSDRFPDVLTKLRELLDKYRNGQAYYVEPDNRSFGGPIRTVTDSLKLYLGPDESYEPVAIIYKNTILSELGYQDNNDKWIFTEYDGQYGWIRTVADDDKTPTIIYEEYMDKPVIYLYPEKETDVHVELELTEAELSTTYPRYNNGWDVTAYPDGKLLNKADGTNHRYLFWDAVNCRTKFDFSTGFCVSGSDTESFLKEKLTYMGLTEDEMNEFIVYWLPLMEHNRYNLISFQGKEYTNSAKLNITPTPDSMLRIFMTYIPLENAVDIEPQQLDTFERKGFTVVEWGGSKISTLYY
jgi:hypothetical protein